jgi:6-phosphogluconolactonase
MRFPRFIPTLLLSAMSVAAHTLYLGNYADAIRAAEFDPVSGVLGPDRAVAPLARASFLDRSADGRFLYAVAEGKPGLLAAYVIVAEGALTSLNTHTSEGSGPCDIALSPDGRLVAAANYSGGSVIVHRVAADGSLGEKAAFFQHTHAANAHPDRQKNPHAHGVTWSPEGRLLIVPDLGGDRVYLYARNADDTLAPNPGQPWLALAPAAGPRHAQFSPDGRHLYVINELDNTVAVAAYDPAGATFTVIETVSTLPTEGFAGFTKTAEVAVRPDGRFVYASNRGHDSLAVFARDADTGRLSPRGHVAVPANPRHFALSPDGRWLLSAGQDTSTVRVYAVDAETGGLSPVGADLPTPKPVCVNF